MSGLGSVEFSFTSMKSVLGFCHSSLFNSNKRVRLLQNIVAEIAYVY